MLAGFGFGAAVAFYGARDGQPGAGLIFLGFAILSLASLVAEVASVQISNDSITIRYLGWQKTIAFEAITNIDLLDLQSRGNVVATVVIERRSGRPIKLMGFREGSVALSDALSSAWREASGRSQQPRSASSSD